MLSSRSNFIALTRRRSVPGNLDVARILVNSFPACDPRDIKVTTVKKLLEETGIQAPSSSLSSVIASWKRIYNGKLYESVYGQMATTHEAYDGELPTGERDRLRVEADPNYKVPDVTAAEALLRIPFWHRLLSIRRL